MLFSTYRSEILPNANRIRLGIRLVVRDHEDAWCGRDCRSVSFAEAGVDSIRKLQLVAITSDLDVRCDRSIRSVGVGSGSRDEVCFVTIRNTVDVDGDEKAFEGVNSCPG
jgi:hypothetical protein